MDTKASVIISLAVLFISLQAVSSYHCTNVLRIESDGLLNHLRNVSFVAPRDHKGQWVLVMKTDIAFTFIGGWKVWVQSDAEAGIATFRSRETDLVVTKGDVLSMRFRISWGRHSKEPRVISLIWNDEQICD